MRVLATVIFIMMAIVVGMIFPVVFFFVPVTAVSKAAYVIGLAMGASLHRAVLKLFAFLGR